jgi:hypothetical protein
MSKLNASQALQTATTNLTPAPSGILQRKCGSCGNHTIAGDKCDDCRNKKGVLQRKSSNDSKHSEAPPIVGEVLQSSGQPLDANARSFFESRFGYNFSRVRVHTNVKAANSAQAVRAQAYTVGENIVFGAGRYNPETREGKKLLAHELTHVVQQQRLSRTETMLHRLVNNQVATDAGSESEATDTTGRLLDLIANAEQIHSRANQKLAAKASEGAPDVDASSLEESQKYVNGLNNLLIKLREVVSSNDESLKRHVLEEFTSEKLADAEGDLRSQNQPKTARVNIREIPDEGVAAAPLNVSHPLSAAEMEADRVAAQIISGENVTVERQTSVSTVFRQGEWAMGAGTAILAFQASGPAEIEAMFPGPGWIALGATLLVAGALIGAGTLMMSRRSERTRAAERAEPTTGTPTPPPPDLCRTAIKILTQFERLAQKYGLNLSPRRIEELNRLRDSGQITINHIPGSLRDPFPLGTFGEMTLAAIRLLCGM